MPFEITKENKKKKYLFLALGLAVFLIIFLTWTTIVKNSQKSLEEATVSQISLKKVEIDLDVLRKPLEITLPEFSIKLTADPNSVALGETIDLLADLSDPLNSVLLVYKFDCNDDGEYELVTEETRNKTYLADTLCQYEKEGKYTARVLAEGEFKYFQDGEEKTERKLLQSSLEIMVGEPNLDPVITSCDVDSIQGTTLSGFKINFRASVEDPDGDELSYLWDFGDGSTAPTSNTSHQYKESGVYFPILRVFDLSEGEKKGGEASCYPHSLLLSKQFQSFGEVPTYEGEVGRENPFIPY